MTSISSDTAALVDNISQQLTHLTSRLAQLPPHQAIRLLPRVLDPTTGVLAGFTSLTAAGAHVSTTEAERGAVPGHVCLALHRAVNELRAAGSDLAPHLDTVARLGTQHGAEPALPPAPAPLVVRRGR